MAKEEKNKKKKKISKISNGSPKKNKNIKEKDKTKNIKTNNKTANKDKNEKIVKSKEKKNTQLEESKNINEKEVKKSNNNEEIIEENTIKENPLIAVETFLIVIGLVIIFIVLVFNFYLRNINPSSEDNIEFAVDNSNIIVNNDSNQIPDFNIDKSRNIVRSYLEQKAIVMSDPKVLLQQYGLATENEFAGYEKTADEKYYKTKILYERIKEKFLPYITQEFFKKEYKDIFVSSNGLTHVAVTGTKNEKYTLLRSEIIKGGSAPVLSVWYKTTNAEGIESEEKNMKVEFTLNRGDWVISNIK